MSFQGQEVLTGSSVCKALAKFMERNNLGRGTTEMEWNNLGQGTTEMEWNNLGRGTTEMEGNNLGRGTTEMEGNNLGRGTTEEILRMIWNPLCTVGKHYVSK